MKNKKIENLLESYSDELFGYNDLFIKFKYIYDSGKLPKIILLTGNKGIGKFTFIFHLINYIFSIKTSIKYDHSNFKINKKNELYKKTLLNINENLIYLGCESPNTISIDDIRNLKINLSKPPFNNSNRFIIIDDVELINANASNALLKLVEEPSNFDFFIFINNKKQKLIETLFSRSIEFKVFLSNEQKLNIYKKIKNKFNLNDSFLDDYINYSSPGNFVKFNKIIEENELNSLENFDENIYKLLNIFKKNKNLIYIDLIFLFIDIKFMSLKNLNNENFLKTLELKKKIMNLFNNHHKFNLSLSNVFDQYKNFIRDVR